MQLGVGRGVVHGRGNRLVLQAEDRLDQAGDAGCRIQMADVRLHRTQHARARPVQARDLESLSQGFDFVALLFLTPFVLVGAVTFAAALYCIYCEVTLAMDRENVLFQRQVFGWKWERSYPFSDIKDIRLTEAYQQNKVPVYGVGIHLNGKPMPLTFGSNLSDEEKNWLLGELHGFWQNRDGTSSP